jgi:bifunctional enzyme CysN/CysC
MPRAEIDQVRLDVDVPGSPQKSGLLRFITCGSVDDGKSTLIGRLLFEAGMLFDDQMETLAIESKRVGTQGGDLDFALLLDGLSAEREQGITIDVAYRYFGTSKRKFIVADTPGHEQYTRNMITGASTADAAIILVDARKGILTQTKRHSYLVSLIGIRHVTLAVNKMDLVGYSEARFRKLEREYQSFAKQIGIEHVTCIPLSALRGDNVVARAATMPWYSGSTLLDHLESVEVDVDRLQRLDCRFIVQWVNRPNLDFRGYAGIVAAGSIRPGDRVRVQPSGHESKIARIVTRNGDVDEAVASQSVCLTLADEIDISRGDVISSVTAPAQVASQFEGTIFWMHEQPMMRGRSYLLKIGARTVSATITPIKHKINVNTLEHVAANQLDLNEIGVCGIELDRAIAFDPYRTNPLTGGFILIDRLTNDTVGGGLINHALRRSQNVHWQAIDVDKRAHAMQKGQKSCVLWFTGLSGAGKSTIANLVERRLYALGRHSYLLDGDNVRHGLNKDLGFKEADRVENIRRVAEVAKLMVDAGLITLVSFISPFRSERRMARALVEEGEFIEVFVDTPISVAEERDPKGLYKKARRGEIANFTGIDSPYQPPENAEIRIDTTALTAEEAAEQVLHELGRRGILDGS